MMILYLESMQGVLELCTLKVFITIAASVYEITAANRKLKEKSKCAIYIIIMLTKLVHYYTNSRQQ